MNEGGNGNNSWNLFKRFFGFPTTPPPPPEYRNNRKEEESLLRNDDDDNDWSIRRRRRNFSDEYPMDGREEEAAGEIIPGVRVQIYTDPLEMEKFFDAQIDSIFKSFLGGGNGFGGGFSGFGGGFKRNDEENFQEREQPQFPGSFFGGRRGGYPGHLPFDGNSRDNFSDINEGNRDFMLKDDGNGIHKDQEISVEDVPSEDLRRLMRSPQSSFQNEDNKDSNPPHHIGPMFPSPFGLFPKFQIPHEDGQKGGYYSHSITEKTVILSDGSRETTRTEKSSDGTETTTVIKSDPPPPEYPSSSTLQRPSSSYDNEESLLNHYNDTQYIYDKFFGKK